MCPESNFTNNILHSDCPKFTTQNINSTTIDAFVKNFKYGTVHNIRWMWYRLKLSKRCVSKSRLSVEVWLIVWTFWQLTTLVTTVVVKGIGNLNARLIEYKRSDNYGMHFMGPRCVTKYRLKFEQAQFIIVALIIFAPSILLFRKVILTAHALRHTYRACRFCEVKSIVRFRTFLQSHL